MISHKLSYRAWIILFGYVMTLGITYPVFSEEGRGRDDSEITFKYLLETNEIIQRRSEQGPAKFDPKSGATSGKGLAPDEEDDQAGPPKGARELSAPKEDDVKLVEVESKALSRKQSKAHELAE